MIAGAVGQMFSSRLNSFYTGNQYSWEPRDESFKPGGCLVLPENLTGKTFSPQTALLTDTFLQSIIFFLRSLFHLNIIGSLFLTARLFLLFISSSQNHNSLVIFFFPFLTSFGYCLTILQCLYRRDMVYFFYIFHFPPCLFNRIPYFNLNQKVVALFIGLEFWQ